MGGSKQPITEKPTRTWVTAAENCKPGDLCTTCGKLDMEETLFLSLAASHLPQQFLTASITRRKILVKLSLGFIDM